MEVEINAKMANIWPILIAHLRYNLYKLVIEFFWLVNTIHGRKERLQYRGMVELASTGEVCQI